LTFKGRIYIIILGKKGDLVIRAISFILIQQGVNMKEVSLSRYIKEILKNAQYRKGKDYDCVVAVVPILPGCMTQGANFEEARDNLIDSIELWITVGLREGEKMPAVNNCISSIGIFSFKK
jgi:predicted RNase H-like HicB family nuclease